jgi:hypothetical protein
MSYGFEVNFLLNVDRELDEFDDLYPICIKLRAKLKLSYEKNKINLFKFSYRNTPHLSKHSKEVINGIRFDEDYYYLLANNSKLREETDNETLKWADVIFYDEQKNKFFDENLTPTPNNYNLYVKSRAKEIMKSEEYYKEIVRLHNELIKVPLTDEKKVFVDSLEKALKDAGINVIEHVYELITFERFR